MQCKTLATQSESSKYVAQPPDRRLSMLKVVLRPVPWSHGPRSQSTFVDELSILLSDLLSKQKMIPVGSLLLRLATGWALSGVGIGTWRISVTLKCQIEQLSDEHGNIVRRAV